MAYSAARSSVELYVQRIETEKVVVSRVPNRLKEIVEEFAQKTKEVDGILLPQDLVTFDARVQKVIAHLSTEHARVTAPPPPKPKNRTWLWLLAFGIAIAVYIGYCGNAMSEKITAATTPTDNNTYIYVRMYAKLYEHITMKGNNIEITKSTKVVMLTKTSDKRTVKGCTDYWYKVTYEGKTYWVFGQSTDQALPNACAKQTSSQIKKPKPAINEAKISVSHSTTNVDEAAAKPRKKGVANLPATSSATDENDN